MTRGIALTLPAMLADLEDLVLCESFSADRAALARSAEVVGALGTRLLGARPETIVIDGVTHLRWSFGTPRVLLMGHHDTVWPMGSLRNHPWSVADGIARGPGVLDMKAGLVQMFHALASLPSPDGVCVLVNGDEEIGSATSRQLIEESVRGCAAAFVLEASADEGGALKTARKGTSRYEVVVHGRAAHAGLEPHKGVNAAVEAAHQVLAVAGLGESMGAVGAAPSGLGFATLTPTLLSAGSARNTVPALARVSVDVRAPTAAAQNRIDELMRGLTARTPGARLEVLGGGRLEHTFLPRKEVNVQEKHRGLFIAASLTGIAVLATGGILLWVYTSWWVGWYPLFFSALSIGALLNSPNFRKKLGSQRLHLCERGLLVDRGAGQLFAVRWDQAVHYQETVQEVIIYKGTKTPYNTTHTSTLVAPNGTRVQISSRFADFGTWLPLISEAIARAQAQKVWEAVREGQKVSHGPFSVDATGISTLFSGRVPGRLRPG